MGVVPADRMTKNAPVPDLDWYGPIGDFAHNPLSPIPTADPEAALLFCQALQRLLVTAPSVDTGRAATAPPVTPPPALAAPPELSVVVPVFNEADNLLALHDRLTIVMRQHAPDYQIIFVDDGSTDLSLSLLRHFAVIDPHVVVVELARNFGHQVAITAGLDQSRGRAVMIMDADLQDPPEVLPEFIAKWREGHDVVYAIREQRKEHWLKRVAYAAFYRLLRHVATISIPLDSGDFCIMDRRVVDLLHAMPERNRFVRGIRSWVGLDQVGLAYERQARYRGRSKYTLKRLVYLALDGLISFSLVPLRFITMTGFGVSLLSIMLAVFYAVKKVLVGLHPPGFATLIVSIFFLAGIQLITLGVIGEYIGRISEEVKQRPLYVLRAVHGRTGSCAS